MDVAEIFRRHGDDLFRHLARECGDAHLAKDAVQERFVRLQERAPTDDGAVRTWLFRTGMNVVRDWHRGTANRRRLLASHADRVPGPSAAPDPEARAELGEDVVRLRKALGEPREKERIALLMREPGFTHHGIAKELGTTTAAVGTLIARSLRKLAAAMELRGGLP